MFEPGSNVTAVCAEIAQARDVFAPEINQVGIDLPAEQERQLASLIALYEGSVAYNLPLRAPTSSASSHDPESGSNEESPSGEPWTKGDPAPWPHNVPELPGHILDTVTTEDPGAEGPDTPVVAPVRDILKHLPILVHNIPAAGRRCRVESSMRITLDLVTIDDDASTCKRVGSYQWLTLPDGTTCKRMDEKQMMHAASHDALHLSVAAQCSSPPFDVVNVCSMCKERERKNIEKVSTSAATSKGKTRCEDSPRNVASPVIFVGPPLRDFSNGRVCLKTRVTCYTCHHEEKVGFRLTFTMADSQGRVVGRGVTPPIIAGDNRKKAGNVAAQASRKRRRVHITDDSDHTDERIEPPRRGAPATSSDSPFAPSNLPSGGANNDASSGLHPHLIPPTSEHFGADLTHALASEFQTLLSSHSSPHQGPDPSSGIPIDPDTTTPGLGVRYPPPHVESVAPRSGTMLGGDWVNIVGTGFRSTDRILFGDVAAKTFYWSETAMQCESPPSATPGPVPISIDGVPLIVGGGLGDVRLKMFTYEDKIEHELCVLALRHVGQCLGLSDQSPSTIARTVIGNLKHLPSVAHSSHGNQDTRFQSSAVDLEQSVLGVLRLADHEFGRKSGSTGQTVFPTSDGGRSLLHLAASLGFHTLTEELIRRGADLDKRDTNGYTALHYSTFYGHAMCAQILIQAGAQSDTANMRDCAATTVVLPTCRDDTGGVKAGKEQSGCLDALDPAKRHNGDYSDVDVDASGAADDTGSCDSPARATSAFEPRSVETEAPLPKSTPKKKPPQPDRTDTPSNMHTNIYETMICEGLRKWGNYAEERPRDYVTLLHNIARSNRWTFHWDDKQCRRSGRVTWQADAIIDNVACGHGTGSKMDQARNQAARAVLIHWGYIGPEW